MDISSLLIDSYDFKPIEQPRRLMLVEESTNRKQKVLRLKGLFQKAGDVNENNRIYPIDILKEAINQIMDKVKQRRVVGELDHPPDAKIHLDRVSHLITDVWVEGDEIFGELEVLSKTEKGKILQGLIESGVQLGISSRGIGDVTVIEKNGEKYYKVLPGYQLITWDVVAEPSVKEAYLALAESRNRMVKSYTPIQNKLIHKIKDFFQI